MFTIDLFEEAKKKPGKKKAKKAPAKKAVGKGVKKSHSLGKGVGAVKKATVKPMSQYVDGGSLSGQKVKLDTVKETRRIGRRVMRDWFAIDLAAFGKIVREKTFGTDFTNLWSATKAATLSDFYSSVKNVANLKGSKIVDVKEDAKKIVKKARKYAILHLRENTKRTRTIVKEMSAGVFSGTDMEMASKKATHLLVAHESLGNLFGRADVVRDLIKVVALRLK
jgi:hypothetical protein